MLKDVVDDCDCHYGQTAELDHNKRLAETRDQEVKQLRSRIDDLKRQTAEAQDLVVNSYPPRHPRFPHVTVIRLISSPIMNESFNEQ